MIFEVRKIRTPDVTEVTLDLEYTPTYASELKITEGVTTSVYSVVSVATHVTKGTPDVVTSIIYVR